MSDPKHPDDDLTVDDVERAFADDLLDPATPIAAVRDYLRAAGGDPEAIRQDGAAHVAQLLERRRLAWQDVARRRIARRAPVLARIAELARMSMQQLVERLAALSSDPIGGKLVGAFHKRKPEAATEDELRAVIEEIETLRALEIAERDGNGGDTGDKP